MCKNVKKFKGLWYNHNNLGGGYARITNEE